MATLSSGLRVRRTTNYLSLAERREVVLLTTDRKIQYQQQVIGRKIGILVLRAKTNRLQDLLFCQPARNASLNPTRSGSRSRDVLAQF